MIPNTATQVHLDACLSGVGASFESMVYALPIPKNYKNYNIVHLELLNIVVALKVWAVHWLNKKNQSALQQYGGS